MTQQEEWQRKELTFKPELITKHPSEDREDTFKRLYDEKNQREQRLWEL